MFNLAAEKMSVKEELLEDSVTVPLSGLVQYRSIRQQWLKNEYPNSDDDFNCPCEECAGRVWVQGEDEHRVKVKLEVDDGSMSHPTGTELTGQPMTATDCPDVSLNLPPDSLASFFDDDEEASIDIAQNIAGPTFFWCLTCGKTFTCKESLKRHYFRAHSSEMPFSSLLCGKRFKAKQELTNHQRVHDPARSKVHCTQCLAPFTKTRELMRHQEGNYCRRKEQTTVDSVHFPGTNYGQMNARQMGVATSSLMSPEPADKVTLLDSTGSQSVSSAYQCSICSKTFTTKFSSEHHKRIHREKPYKCSTCGRAYKYSIYLKKHEQFHARVSSVSPLESTDDDPSKAALYQCPTCGKTLTTKYRLRDHRQIHSSQRAFICDICGKNFVQKNNLIMHQWAHNPERSIARCSDCGAPFTRLQDLKRHQEEHCRLARERTASISANLCENLPKVSPENNWGLPLGPVPFAASTSLTSAPLEYAQPVNYSQIDVQPKEMMLSSIPSKPTRISTPVDSPDVIPLFVCSTCGKVFAQKKNYTIHQLVHTERRPFKCSVCGEGFKSQGNCNNHRLSCHLEEGNLRCTKCNGQFDWSILEINHRADCSIIRKDSYNFN